MATNSGNIGVDRRLAEEILRVQSPDRDANRRQGNAGEVERTPAKRAPEGRRPAMEEPRAAEQDAGDTSRELALASLVDQVAYGFAKVLVVAMKELELHIANETRSVGETVGRRLESLQASFQDLAEGVSEQRALSLSVREQCEHLAAATASLQESDARQEAELAALRGEASETSTSVSERIEAVTASLRESDARVEADVTALRGETKELAASVAERIDALSKEVDVQQEDLTAIKSTLCGFSTRVDSLVDRLDRQAEALHSMYTTYSQRESELEQLVEGLTKLRAYPAPAPANRL